MSQVILVRPHELYSSRIQSRRPPLGLLNIAGALKQSGYTVSLIDGGTCFDWKTALQEHLDETTLAVGVSVMTGQQIKGALDLADTVHAESRVPVFWGGLHPSLLPEETLQHPAVDGILVGEGEERFPEVIRRLLHHEPLNGIPGVGWKEDDAHHYTPYAHDYLDMNALPLPAYECIDHEHYATQTRRFMLDHRRCLDLNTDRGCPGRCGYCYNVYFNQGKRWRAASSETVLRWVQELIETYNLDAVNFVSDNFFVDPKRVRDICEGLLDLPRPIHWHADMRIDSFLRYDEDLLQLIRKSGCTTMTFGVESGSDRMLEKISKGITVAEILQAHERLQRFGFLANYHFMIGYPDETEEDLRQTLKLMWTLSRNPNVILYTPSIFIPYPGTPLFHRCCEMGYTPPQSLGEWSICDFEAGVKLPWVTERHRTLLQDIWQTAEGAFAVAPTTFKQRLKRTLYRTHFWTLTQGGASLQVDRYIIRCLRQWRTHAAPSSQK